jgi:hypothetical protein
MLRGPLLDADIVDTSNESLISRQLEGIVSVVKKWRVDTEGRRRRMK